jgi:glycosyltransferase involved in cell wall biosynthesis
MRDSKHIIILGSAYPLRGGGLATFNERLARQYQQDGHRVTIFTFSLQYPSFLFPGTTQYSQETAPSDLDIRVAIHSMNPFNWIRIGLHLKRLKPDLIIVRYWIPFMAPCLSTICRLAKKNHYTRVVCIADNIIPHEHRLGDRMLTNWFLPVPDAFITMSDQVTRDLGSFQTGKPYRQLSHPLYDNFGPAIPKIQARKQLGLDTDEKILLFFGFIRAYKGLDLLLEAMAYPVIRNMRIRLVIAGEFYQNKQPYLDQIERNGLKDVVTLLDSFISDNQVGMFCCAADFIIQPYRQATQSGVTPLAYHFRVPMIVTRVGGLPDMVVDGQTGLIAEPEIKSIAMKIQEAFEHTPEHYLPALDVFRNQLSWGTFAEQLLQLHDAV